MRMRHPTRVIERFHPETVAMDGGYDHQRVYGEGAVRGCATVILLRKGQRERTLTIPRSAALGVSYEAVRAEVEREVAEAEPQPEEPEEPSVCLNPAAYSADGMAKGLGAEAVAAEHVLLALIWEPDHGCGALLEALGAPSEQILAKLRELGVTVPPGEPPPPDPRDWGERVFVPASDVGALMRELEDLVPGIQLAFNYEDEYRAWLQTLEGIELQHHVAVAQERLHGRLR